VSAVHPDDAERYKALYSSDLGGVVTEPALMVVAADDHGVHRGHAVFDTAALIEGRIYLLDAHLDRFYGCAAAAGLTLPFSRAQVRRTVLETAAAARTMDGSIRMWLGAGRGGYGLSPAECRRPSLHVAVYTPRPAPRDTRMTPDGEPTGITVRTSTALAPPDPWAARIKSTNYLRNALAQAEAEAAGFDLGAFADPESGIVTEAVNAALGIVTQEGELVIAPFDRSLASVTAQRVVDLLPAVRLVFLYFFSFFFLACERIFNALTELGLAKTRSPCPRDDESNTPILLQITIFRMRLGVTRPLIQIVNF
jgi:4-amino-4-deoxychorismate lyase